MTNKQKNSTNSAKESIKVLVGRIYVKANTWLIQKIVKVKSDF